VIENPGYSTTGNVAPPPQPQNLDDFVFDRQWTSIGPYGGQVYDIEFDTSNPNIMFAGAYYGDGLYRSSNSGDTWSPVLTGQEGGDLEGEATFRNTAVWAVKIAPGNSNVVWAVHNYWAEFSLNAGADWSHIKNSEMQQYDEETCPNCGGEDDDFRFCRALAIDPGNPQTVYIGTGGPDGTIPNGAIYKTTNDGDTWTKTGYDEFNNFDNTVVDIAVDPNNTANVWAITASFGYNGYISRLYKSTDYGASWTIARTETGEIFYDLELWPADTSKVFIAGYFGILSNYTGSWGYTYNGYVGSLAFDPQNTNVLYAAAGRSGLVRGFYSGGVFTFGSLSNLGLEFLAIAVKPNDGNVVFGGEVSKGIFKATYNGTFSAVEQNEGVNSLITYDIDVIPAVDSTPAHLIAATGLGVFIKNGGGDWTPVTGLPNTRTFSVAFDPSVPDGSDFWVGGEGYLARTLNGGSTWSVNYSIPGTMRVSDIAVASNGSPRFVTTRSIGGGAGRVYKSTGSGTSLSEVLSSSTFDFNTVVIDPTDSNRALAGGGNFYAPKVNGLAYLTTSGGTSWTPTGLTDVIVNALLIDPDDPQVVYAGCGYSGGTEVPMYKSTDGGVSWQPFDGGIPGAPIRYGLWGSGANDVFVLGHTGSTVKGGYDDMKIWHFDGSNWSNDMDSGVLDHLKGIWGSGPNDVFAVGNDGAIVYYNGAGWSEAPGSRTTPENLNSLWGQTGSNVYAVGNAGVILHYNGSNWSTMTSPTNAHLYGVWGEADGLPVYAVGSTGTILQYNGSSWMQMTSGVKAQLTGVWGVPGGAEVFAVGAPKADGLGGVQYTILRFNGAGWSAMTTPTVVPGMGKLRAVWGTAGSDVFAVGDDGVILHYNGSNWSAMASGSTADLYGVWGLSASQVYAVGRHGTVLYNDGAQWANVALLDDQSIPIVWLAPWNAVTDLKFKVDEQGNRNIYASTDRQGIYFSPNAAESWINLLSPPYSVFALGIGSIYVASYGVHPFTGTGWISGRVLDELTLIGLDNALVSTDIPFEAATNPDGIYALGLPAGNYNLTGEANGYNSETAYNVPSIKDGNTVNYYLTDPLTNACVCDFDQDGDVDGKDLAGYANGIYTGPTLSELALELGRSNCLPP